MRARLDALFQFGSCDAAVCLIAGSDLNVDHAHDFDHDATSTATLLSRFIDAGIVTSIDNLPRGSTTSGVAFTFTPDGVPVAQSGSEGPIVTERSQPLGRHRFLFGVQGSYADFSAIRGVSLDSLHAVFTTTNDAPMSAGGLGAPGYEFDTVGVSTALSASVRVIAVSLAYGINNSVEVGVTVPVERISFSGTSIASIGPGAQTHHIFGVDTLGGIQRVDSASSSGSATGVGDVIARMKVNLVQRNRAGAALLAAVRLPTGTRSQLLGTGAVGGELLAVGSLATGPIGEHVNVGYLLRSGESEQNAIVGIAGLDARVLPRVTLAAEVATQWQVGSEKIPLPSAASFIDGASIARTNIPDMRDDIVNGSFGMKLLVTNGLTLVTSALVPFTDGGVRTGTVWSVGVQSNF
jgi:hypothetical protein